VSAARTTISMPDQLFATAVERQRELGYSTFSDYIQALIRADSLQSGPHLREAAKAAAPLPAGNPVNYRKAKRQTNSARPSSADTERKVVDIVQKHHPKAGPPPKGSK